jgi:putative phosphoribosyl transferase
VPKNLIDSIVRQIQERINRQIINLRKGEPFPQIKGRTVIIVDDGIAMGSTMRAAVMMCREKGADKVIVASPVAGSYVAESLEEIADEVVILEMPEYFSAVAQVYEKWHDVSDPEVIETMDRWRKQKVR